MYGVNPTLVQPGINALEEMHQSMLCGGKPFCFRFYKSLKRGFPLEGNRLTFV